MKIRITNDGAEKDINEIYTLIKDYNLSHREPSENVPLGIYYENDQGEKQAGLVGETFGNWLCIHYLFVAEQLRGQGVGKKLIESAEETAKKRGSKYAFVDTFSFQAPGFYEKLGFKEVFALKNYPYTEARYYYTKEL